MSLRDKGLLIVYTYKANSLRVYEDDLNSLELKGRGFYNRIVGKK
jgi:hypothetical protein